MVSVSAAEIKAVQAGITRLLIEGSGGATGTIVWHVGKEPGQVILEMPLRGSPAQVLQAQAVVLAASQQVAQE
jgi:hypothetical protein